MQLLNSKSLLSGILSITFKTEVSTFLFVFSPGGLQEPVNSVFLDPCFDPFFPFKITRALKNSLNFSMGIPDIPGAEPQFGTDRLQIPFNSNPALPKVFFHILDPGARDLAGSVFCKEFSDLKEIGKLFNPDS